MKVVNNKNGNTVRIFNTFDDLTVLNNAVFLAGGTLRLPYKGDKKSWRKEAIELLLENNYNGDIIIPEWENDTKPENYDYEKQVNWELEGLYKSSKIIFWIPRDMNDLPCLTTNIEFGNFVDSNKIFVGGNDVKNDYIKYRVKRNKKVFYENLNEMIEKVCEVNKVNIWFSSDTHFNQERTLELSKRPHQNVNRMNLDFISNWNTNISSNDTVYFLGDFGDVEILDCLNFRKMFFMVGNYERNNVEILKKLKDNPRVVLIESNVYTENFEGIGVIQFVHEPEHIIFNDIFTLFGHVHQLSMIKTNALNVGIDAHRFNPINIQTVKFYKEAIQKFYDMNVFNNFPEKKC